MEEINGGRWLRGFGGTRRLLYLSYEERMKETVVRMLGEEYLLPFMDASGDGG